MSGLGEGPQQIGVHPLLLGTEDEVLTEGVTNGRGDRAPVTREVRGGAVGARLRARCWLAQQSARIRSGSSGALHQHLMVRQMDLHVHLLSARVGSVMKTYSRQIGELFERERNDRAPRRGSYTVAS